MSERGEREREGERELGAFTFIFIFCCCFSVSSENLKGDGMFQGEKKKSTLFFFLCRMLCYAMLHPRGNVLASSFSSSSFSLLFVSSRPLCWGFFFFLFFLIFLLFFPSIIFLH